MEKIDLTQDTARIRTLDKGTLHRKLGVRDIFGVAYGDVGSSIIYALGVVAALAYGATPLAIGVAGVFFIFTALTYAELGATIPEAGGAQIFARRAFRSDLVSFIAGWALLLDYVLTAAISAYTIGPYLGHLFAPLKQPLVIISLASVVLLILAGLNVHGIRDSTRLSLWLSLTCIATFAFLIGWGMVHHFDWSTFVSLQEVGTRPTWSQFLNAVALSMVAYIGIEAGTQLAGEAKDPGRTVPNAIKMTVLVLLAVYAGTVAVAMCMPNMPELLGTYPHKEQPLITIAHGLHRIGPWFAAWMSILAAIVLFIATNAGLIGASRLAYSMATHFQLPRSFQMLHSKRRTPVFALLFFTFAAVGVLLLTQKMDRLAELYNFGSMLAFSMAHLSLIGLRIREPNLDRPYKVGLNLRIAGRRIPVTAMLGFLATGATWIYVVIHQSNARLLGFGWLLAGVVLYALFRRREEVPLVESVKIERVSMPEYAPWEVRHVLVPTLGGANTEVVQVACRIAALHGAQVTALYVIEIPEALPLETFFGGQSVTGDKALDRAEAIGREYGVQVRRKKMQAREAGSTIAEVAKEEGCDLIVMGAAPRSTGGTLFGRTVDAVARRAPCRVIICSGTHTV
ncbi:MAG: universal stress protein [Planctomycetes bacterium]|nr:universal stress protein [Planctomycetota bacterium]